MAKLPSVNPLPSGGGLVVPSSPVPVLRLRGNMWDPVALDTWREALSSLVATEVPHELLGLWLYTPDHHAVLIGPPALEADHLDVPVPSPQVDPKDLWQLEERIRVAGYGSALAITIAHGDRDVGLALFAGLDKGSYQDDEVAFVSGILAGLGPTMARVGQQWSHDGEIEEDGATPLYRRRDEPGRALHELRDLLADLADTIALSVTPASLAEGLSHALAGMVPHDWLEILVPHPPRMGHYRLAAHDEGPLFARNDLWCDVDQFDPAAVHDEGVCLVSDTSAPGAVPAWPLPVGGDRHARSVVGVRLGHLRSPVGYLLLGSQGPGMYGPEDVEALRRLAPLVTPRVEQFSLAGQVQTLRTHLGVLRQVPSHFGRIAELLATTAHLGVATRLFAQEASGVLPFERLEFALRIGRESDVVVVSPGDTRALSDLQPVDVSGTELGRVLRSEITHTLAAASRTGRPDQDAPSAALVVPLRVAGRVVGTMTLVATGSDSFSPTDVVLAQQLADIAAPHLELARRAALASPIGARRVER
jgi:hypothetical protein